MKKQSRFFLAIVLMLTSLSLLAIDLAQAESRLTVGINWQDSNYKDLQIKANQEQQGIQQCLDTGLKQTATFYFQICKHRSLWFDPCLKLETSEKILSFDALSQSYMLNEKSSFEYNTAIGQFDSPESAFQAFLSINGIDINELTFHSDEFKLSKRSYVSVRVMLSCKGEKDDLVGEVSRLLSFGIVKLNEEDTGWVDFRLYKPKNK